jgi:hypothetical protein
LVTTDHLDDALSGDRDAAIRAEVTFGAGANSWRASDELRQRVFAAVSKTSAPIMLIHAANDYATQTPSLKSFPRELLDVSCKKRSQNKLNCSSTACTGHFVANAERSQRWARVSLYFSRRRAISCESRLA